MIVSYAEDRRARRAIGCAVLLSLWAVPVFAGAQQTRSSASAVTVAIQKKLPAPTADVARELNEFVQAWAAVQAYSATVTVFERKGTQVQNVVFDYRFRKPTNVTVHVVSGTNAGVTLTWNGGPTVVGRRGSGIAALFKRTLSLHDPLATTIRGSSIDQLSFGAILAHARGIGTLATAPSEEIDGNATEAMSLTSADPAANAGLTREILALSPITHLPVRVLGFNGPTLVRQIDFSKVVLTQ